jgi:hypothetical protein
VKATAAAIEQAFFVNLVFRRRTDGTRFVSVDRNPSLNLSVPILEVSGLNDYFPPQPGLINQLGSPTPLTPNQPLSLIRFIITTGNDDAGGGLHGSSQTADSFLPVQKRAFGGSVSGLGTRSRQSA